MTVVDWTLRLNDKFSGPGKSIADTTVGMGGAAGDAAAQFKKFGDAVDKAGNKVRDSKGRFLPKGGIGVPELPKFDFPKPGLVLPPGDIPKPALVPPPLASLSDQFDKLQSSLGGGNANAILYGQSVARGLATFKKLREEARAAAGATDIERGLNSFIPTALLQASKKLGGFERIIQKIGKTFGPKAAQGALGFSKAFVEVGEGLATIAPIALPVAGALVAIGGAAVAGAVKFASAVVSAQAFKEDITRALVTITKSQQGADEVLKTAAKASDLLGISRPQAAAAFADLLTKGFDLGKVDEIVKRLADLATVDPNASIERLTQLIGKIKALGKINQDVITDLSTAGLEAGDVFAALAKSTGKSIAQVQKDLSAGNIDSTAGIAAVLEAIKQQTGGLAAGEAAAAKNINNISSLLGNIAKIPENVLFDLDVGPGLDTVKSALREILALTDSNTESGKAFRDALGGAFSALVEGFLGKEFDSTSIKDTFKQITDTLKNSKEDIKKFGQDLRTIAEAIGAITRAGLKLQELTSSVSFATPVSLQQFYQLYEIVGMITDRFGGLGDLLWNAMGGPALEAIGDAISGLWDRISEFFSSLTDSISGLAETFFSGSFDIGGNITDGISQGISSGASGIVDSITSAVQGAIDSAKALLGIASPSKVFAELGDFTAQGFGQGIAANDTGNEAIGELVAPPTLAEVRAGGAAVGGQAAAATAAVGASGGSGSASVSITVNAPGATAADAQTIADMAAERVIAALENIGLSVGAAA